MTPVRRDIDRALAELEKEGKLRRLVNLDTREHAWLEADRPTPQGYDPAPRSQPEGATLRSRSGPREQAFREMVRRLLPPRDSVEVERMLDHVIEEVERK